MQYYFSTIVPDSGFDHIKEKVSTALKTEGFGVLTEIDIKATMKAKLDKDYLPHVILGACNPVYADKVLQTDMHISTLLPCNVTLRKLESGDVEICAVNPLMAMSGVQIEALEPIAGEVAQKLERVIQNLKP
jgi:uncharacterized protein (DUF302 family)